MRRREGLAEELSRLFYERSGPTLRAAQRRLAQPGALRKLAQVLGLVVGGLLIVVAGTLPWWELGSREANGLDLMRGRAAFSFGALLAVVGLVRAATSSLEIRLTSVAAGLLMSSGVMALALVERAQYNDLNFNGDILGFFSWGRSTVREGLMLTLYGGIMAFVGSLCGLARDPDPDGAPTLRSHS